MQVDHLAFVHENFFEYDVTKERFHEISLFFVMKDQLELDTICMSFTEDGAKEHLHWLDMNHLKDEFLYPEFFKEELSKLGMDVKHVVTRQV